MRERNALGMTDGGTELQSALFFENFRLTRKGVSVIERFNRRRRHDVDVSRLWTLPQAILNPLFNVAVLLSNALRRKRVDSVPCRREKLTASGHSVFTITEIAASSLSGCLWPMIKIEQRRGQNSYPCRLGRREKNASHVTCRALFPSRACSWSFPPL